MTNVSAAERAAANQPMSDAEEIRQMKLQIQSARRDAAAAAAAQPGAAKKTANASAGEKKALSDYQGKAQSHYNKWHAKNGGKYSTQAAEMAAWQTIWADSEEGKAAKKELEPHLLEYSKAVQDEMRLAAEASGGNPDVIAQKRDEINRRDHSGSWADTVLDGMVTGLAVTVTAESPALRSAILNTDGAFAEKKDADSALEALLAAKAEGLGG